MSTIADSLVSSSSRALRIRMRPDVSSQRQLYLGRSYWVVKDPIAMKYYRFQEEEYAILQMLDGETSLDEIRHRFQHQFPPQQITLAELNQFIGMLHRSSLVISSAAAQGDQLLSRRGVRKRRERWAAMSNVLCIRWKGFDPDRVLNWLHARIGWLFSLPVLVLAILLVSAALLLITVQFDIFRSKLPAFGDFFAARNWLWLGATLAVTKVLHEFGHGLSCKRFGGECHEMGVMLLVLTPCLYCNVSDSWMLPSKWQRAAIGAAGMYVEVVLASICTFIWWFTEPGLIHYLALNVMFISSVSTILFNANPLLRYDGYYILSDLTEIPNLRQKSSTILHSKLGAWLLGLEESEDPFLPQQKQIFFALYTVAAAAYRWVVVLSILWFLYHVFEPYGLQIFGQMIAAMALYGLLVQPLWRLGKFFYVPGRIDKVKKPRMWTSLAVIGALLLGILLVPLPHRVRCSLQILPFDAQPVYIVVPGRLSQIDARPGQKISKNAPLVTLENLDIRLELSRLEGQQRQHASRLDSLRQRQFTEKSAGLEIKPVEELLAAVEEQLTNRRQELDLLEITAPAAGTVLPPPRLPADNAAAGQLPAWSGSPLEEKNLGAYLTGGVLLCQIGDPQQLEAILAIDQVDVEFIRAGQKVQIKLAQLPGKTFHSQIEQVSELNRKISPRGRSAKADRDRSTSTTYQASSPLTDKAGLMVIGASGQAKIHAGYQTLASRIWRYLSQTFSFQM